MASGLSGEEIETRSFASEKNGSVHSVQFVMRTDAIQKPEQPQPEEEKEQELNFWQKLGKLFGIS